MAVPEKIRKMKPVEFGSCIVKQVNGHFYVYEATSQWNKETQRPRKITGRCLGKIVESDGFIPNRYGLMLMEKKKTGPPREDITEVNYGAYEMLQQLSPAISQNLKEFFPMNFREIRTLALLRLVDGISPELAEPIFLDSYISDLCPDLAMSEETIQRFTLWLGLQVHAQESFMRKSIMPGTKLVFDGTSFFADFEDSLSQRGYNPEHRQLHQVKLLYIFDEDSFKPVFYQLFQGSAVDKTSFLEVIAASGCSKCIIIADNGFYSKRNLSILMNSNLNIEYLLPLKKNTALVPSQFYEDRDPERFNGMFAYSDRVVYWRKVKSGDKGNFVYTFFDPKRQSREQASFLQRNGRNALSHTEAQVDRRGYLSLVSNMDQDGQDVYLTYKERQDVEQFYDYLKNTLHSAPVYAHTNEGARGWAFLNHIAMLYYYGLVHALRKSQMAGKWTPSQVLLLAKNVRACKCSDGEFRVPHIQQKTKDILESLQIHFEMAGSSILS